MSYHPLYHCLYHSSLVSVSSDEEGLAPGSGDIPQDISADDEPLSTPTAISAGAGVGAGVGTSEPQIGMITGDTAALVVEVLKELDKDYMALRSRLVTLIEQQAPRNPDLPRAHSLESEEGEGEGRGDMSNGVNRQVTTEEGVRETEIGQDSTDLLSNAARGHDSSSSHPAPDALSEGESQSSRDDSRPAGTRMKYWPSRQLVRS